jgi:hypothetical protein
LILIRAADPVNCRALSGAEDRAFAGRAIVGASGSDARAWPPLMAAPNYGLEGKVALVTGAASGIGRATAELFAAQGARLVASDVEEGAGAEVVERLGEAGGSASFVRGRRARR